MRVRKIPKGGNRFRTIYVPNAKEKRYLTSLLPFLTKMERDAAHKAGVGHCAHGFVNGRNPVTCALPHIGYAVTVSCDLSDWFDSVTDKQLLAAGVPSGMVDLITVDGACRQGLPTSPAAANLVAVKFDAILIAKLKERFRSTSFAYSRYADDVTVSFTNDATPNCLVDAVTKAIWITAWGLGWSVNESKTHVQTAVAGRRTIVGISVGKHDIKATRQTRRKLRAANHQAGPQPNARPTPAQSSHRNSARGLAEWAACKLPRCLRGPRRIIGIIPGASSAPAPKNHLPQTVVVGSARRILLPPGAK